MHNNYNSVRTVSREEFESLSESADGLTPSKHDEVAAIERLLDVRPGTLGGGEDYSFENAACKQCGHELNMYDFVLTALVDADHEKSFVLHTLLGSKLIVNRARQVRCSVCGNPSEVMHRYRMGSGYGCQAH